MLLAQLHALKRKTCPYAPVPVLCDHFRELRTDLPPQWVKPTLVVQIDTSPRKSRDNPTNKVPLQNEKQQNWREAHI